MRIQGNIGNSADNIRVQREVTRIITINAYSVLYLFKQRFSTT